MYDLPVALFAMGDTTSHPLPSALVVIYTLNDNNALACDHDKLYESDAIVLLCKLKGATGAAVPRVQTFLRIVKFEEGVDVIISNPTIRPQKTQIRKNLAKHTIRLEHIHISSAWFLHLTNAKIGRASCRERV